MGSKHRRRTRSRLKQYHFIPRYTWAPLALPPSLAHFLSLSLSFPSGSLVWPRQVLYLDFSHRIPSADYDRQLFGPLGHDHTGIRTTGRVWSGAARRDTAHSTGSSRSHTPSSPSSLTWRSEFPSTVLRVFVATGNRRISRYAARQMLFPK